MSEQNNIAMHGDNRKLEEVFLDGWQLYEFLDETTIDTNSVEYRSKVVEAMKHLELATTLVSQIGMFSSNELIDEVSTESLPFLLLPYFLGKLALKRNEQERGDALRIAEIYFIDFLQRCNEYDLCENPNVNKDNQSVEKQGDGCLDTTQQLVASAVARNNKIAQFKRKKELEEYVKKMREAVRNHTVEDEIKRDFYLKLLQKSIIDTNEELQDLTLEKGIVAMRKQRMAEFGKTHADDLNLPLGFKVPPSNALRSVNTDVEHNHGHGHSHAHQHHHHPNAPPRPKPMQPFIIARDAAQKVVFGLGYPSLPVMTVDDFYTQRVKEGIFPDAEKMARINQEKALAAMQDPEELEEQEKAIDEKKVENDDPENIERMRRRDEYNDVVRRGDGNRHNRS